MSMVNDEKMSKSRRIFLMIFIHGLTIQWIVAQGSSAFLEHWVGSGRFSLSCDYNQELGSNGITTRFFRDYISGDFLSDEVKQECIDQLKEENTALVYYTGGIHASWSRGEEKVKYLLSAGFTSFNEVKFHKDLFALYFTGNKGFEGTTAELHPFGFQNVEYSYLKAGIERKWNRFTLTGKIGLAAGYDVFTVNTERGSLFTANDGKYLDLSVKMNSADWIGNKRLIWNSDALGFLVDAGCNVRLFKGSCIEASVSNVGSISWNGNIKERTADTLYRYEGTVINNLLDTFSLSVKSVKTLESEFIKDYYSQSRKTNLPVHYSVSLNHFWAENTWHANLEVGKLDGKYADPYFMIGCNHIVTNFFSAGIRIKKFSYSGWDAGVQTGIKLGKSFGILLYWDSVGGILDDSREMNWSGGLHVRWNLLN